MKENVVCSHERSGTNFLIEVLKVNFDLEFTLRHNPYHPYMLDDFNYLIHIVRDGRSVMTSWWRLLRSGWEFYKLISPLLKEISFQDFLRGKAQIKIAEHNPNWFTDPANVNEYNLWHFANNVFPDPIDYWARHTEGYLDSPIYSVRFEDLKLKYEQTVQNIGYHFNFTPVVKKPVPVSKLVGPVPEKGEISGWRKFFSSEDLEVFWRKAGNVMHRLKYER